MKPPVIERLLTDDIVVSPGRRDVDHATVKALAESMKQIGLRTPITVLSDAEGRVVTLVAGGHRLAAAKLLGWDEIDCFVIEGDEIDAELWEIAENLHRAELTVLQRDTEIARWVELVEMKVSQVGTPIGGKQPNESGIRKAAHELNIPKSNVHRAVKVSRLTPEARAAAKAEGLDDNQSALLAAAAAAPEAQVQAIHDIAERRRRIAEQRANIPEQKEWEDVEAEQLRRLMAAWNAASPAVKQRFRDQIDTPVMDARFA